MDELRSYLKNVMFEISDDEISIENIDTDKILDSLISGDFANLIKDISKNYIKAEILKEENKRIKSNIQEKSNNIILDECTLERLLKESEEEWIKENNSKEDRELVLDHFNEIIPNNISFKKELEESIKKDFIEKYNNRKEEVSEYKKKNPAPKINKELVKSRNSTEVFLEDKQSLYNSKLRDLTDEQLLKIINNIKNKVDYN